VIDGETTQTKAPLVPPRPNLGPEPMPESNSWYWVALAAIVVVGAIVGALGRRTSRGRRARRRPVAKPLPDGHETVQAQSEGAPDVPIIQHADAIRSALVARFGSTWAAKTTEEIGAQQELGGPLDADQRTWLLHILTAADRVKFSGDGQPHDQGDEAWATRSASIVAALAPETGATSSTSGK
jgi:hypothetical protein